MKVKCTKNILSIPALVLPKNLTEEIDWSNNIASIESFTIDGDLGGYDLDIQEEYTVYGFLSFENQKRVLICDKNNIPGFFPLDLFTISEHTILFDWEIGIYQMQTTNCVVFGYPELVNNYQHFVGLIENKAEDIRIFLSYKRVIETYY